MAIFGFFRRQPSIREVSDLADFIDQRGAYLIQRYIYDYTHARSGPFSQRLLGLPDFAQAVERSRWSAYPLGLAMMGEMVEGVLAPHAAGDRRSVLDPVTGVVLGVYDRYETEASKQIGVGAWRGAREELARQLDRVGTHPPKSVSDIPEPYAERYFNMMPFDKELLTNDVPTTRSYLRLTLTNIRDDLAKHMNAAVIAAKLRGGL